MKKKFYKGSGYLNPEFFLSVIKNLKKELDLLGYSVYLDTISIKFKDFELDLYSLSNTKYHFIKVNFIEKKIYESFKEYHNRRFKKISIDSVIKIYKDNIKNIESVTIIKKDLNNIPDPDKKYLCLFFNGYIRINIEKYVKLIYSCKKHEIINQDYKLIESLLKDFKNSNYEKILYNNQLLYLTDYYIIY